MVLILLIELSRHNCDDSKEKRCIFESFLHVLLLCVTLQLKEMVLALLHESDLILSDEYVEQIVDKVQITVTCHLHFHAYLIYIFKISCLLQTFNDADSNGDGRIDPEEWKEFVSKNPSLIKNMTLPYLKWVLNFTCSSIIDLKLSVSCVLLGLNH